MLFGSLSRKVEPQGVTGWVGVFCLDLTSGSAHLCTQHNYEDAIERGFSSDSAGRVYLADLSYAQQTNTP